MSLQNLAPVNSQRAQQTAINAFSRFLVAEGVNMQFIAATLQGDMTGPRFVMLMDRFAIHLTSAEAWCATFQDKWRFLELTRSKADQLRLPVTLGSERRVTIPERGPSSDRAEEEEDLITAKSKAVE
ncbi:hypothetical protein PHMEG_00027406 [Phytophthora megakarya]|uniref:Uncharacterized protein n=1 Tax=Phytophthora megakarya TaxID=4795 RepID=A0A225V8Y1_9STRA|nr:hypothetical protein PHMEG_00027406 [Phytophthora megakarya]